MESLSFSVVLILSHRIHKRSFPLCTNAAITNENIDSIATHINNSAIFGKMFGIYFHSLRIAHPPLHFPCALPGAQCVCGVFLDFGIGLQWMINDRRQREAKTKHSEKREPSFQSFMRAVSSYKHKYSFVSGRFSSLFHIGFGGICLFLLLHLLLFHFISLHILSFFSRPH